MAGADAFGEDKKAYEDYLDTIENVEEEKEKKKGGLLGRFKFWGKKKGKVSGEEAGQEVEKALEEIRVAMQTGKEPSKRAFSVGNVRPATAPLEIKTENRPVPKAFEIGLPSKTAAKEPEKMLMPATPKPKLTVVETAKKPYPSWMVKPLVLKQAGAAPKPAEPAVVSKPEPMPKPAVVTPTPPVSKPLPAAKPAAIPKAAPATIPTPAAKPKLAIKPKPTIPIKRFIPTKITAMPSIRKKPVEISAKISSMPRVGEEQPEPRIRPPPKILSPIRGYEEEPLPKPRVRRSAARSVPRVRPKVRTRTRPKVKAKPRPRVKKAVKRAVARKAVKKSVRPVRKAVRKVVRKVVKKRATARKAVKKKARHKKRAVARKAVRKPVKKKLKPKKKTVKIKAKPKRRGPGPAEKSAKNAVKLAEKTSGWYGGKLKHKKASLEGWHFKKKLQLLKLRRKKDSKKGLNTGEKERFTRLKADETDLVEKIKSLNKQLKAVTRVGKKIKAQGVKLAKKAKEIDRKSMEAEAMAPVMPKPAPKAAPKPAAAPEQEAVSETVANPVSVPTLAKPPVETAPKPAEVENLRKEEELKQVGEMVKDVAKEVASELKPQAVVPKEEKESIEDLSEEIGMNEQMLKNLEMAFYKRKISFEQFREKLFAYQSKLSELNLRRDALKKKQKGKLPEKKKMEDLLKRPEIPKLPETKDLKPMLDKAVEDAVKKREAEKKPEVKKEEPKPPEHKIDINAKVPEEKKKPEEEKKTFPKLFGKKPVKVEEEKKPALPKKEIAKQVAEAKPMPGIKPETPTQPKVAGAMGLPGAKPIAPAAPKPEITPKPGELGRTPTIVKPNVSGFPKKMPAPKFIKTITETKGRRMPKPKMEEPKKKPRTKYVERGMERAPLGRPPKPPELQPIRVAPIDTKELLSAMRDMIKNKRPDEKEQFIVPESPKINIIRPLLAGEAMAGARKPKEKLKSVEKDIIKQKIVTDFDKILNYVRENGFATAGKISADLGIDKKTINRYAKVLEENELIKVSYPAIGSMKLIDIDFKPKPKGKDKKAESNK